MSNLYSRIEFLCHNAGVSITKMCKESGANRASLSDLKMGRKKTLSAETLAMIAAYFHTTVEHLLGVEHILENEKGPSEDEPLSDADRRLIEWFRSLPPEKQRAILIAQDAPEDVV